MPDKKRKLISLVILAIALILAAHAAFTVWQVNRLARSRTEVITESIPTPSAPQQLSPSLMQKQNKVAPSVNTAQLPRGSQTKVLRTPPQENAWVDPSNYGERLTQDALGHPISNRVTLVVLHETVISGRAAIAAFQTHRPDDLAQASYHDLILRNGTVVHLVPLEKRAFGAGNSVFYGANGPETVQTNPKLPSSVNNFSYHISLESPADGNNKNATHSGYTAAEYQSLAWLIKAAGIPTNRITTHYAVDRTGTRKDPRSFDYTKLFELLAANRA